MRIIKIENLIYENIELKQFVPIEFDNQGNPTKFEERFIDPRLENPNFLKQCLKDTLIYLERQRIKKVLNERGYIDLGDIQFYHQQDPDDPEPKGLLEWYQTYDNAIWEEIDNLKSKTYGELENYDPAEVETQIFEQTKEKLPPLRD